MPPPPPPPPPPGPGPPGPPPPPMGAPVPKSNVMPDRTGLLGDIAKGKQLKKAVTNDRSAPSVGGGVVSNDSAPKIGRPPTIPGANSGRVSSAPQVESGVSHDGPQLAGIFAGGMPTLKKTSNGIRSNVQGGSLTSQSSRSVSSPSAKPPSVPGGPSRILPPAPGHRPSNSTNLPSSAPPPPPPTAPAPPLPQSFISTTKNANSIPMRPAPPQQVTQNANGPSISAPPLPPPSRPSNNPPSLPTAPPPPLPTTASPGLPNPRASLPSPVRTVTPPPAPPAAPPSSAIPQAPYVPVSNPTRISSYAQPQPPPPPPAPPATGPNLNGLQAALASRTSSQANPSRPNSMSSSVVAPNSFDAATTAPSGVSYSLKPQHVKRVDDSKYKFQPDNALPTVRPFTGCHKPYKSGRPGGTTVPLNLDAYR